MSSADPVLTDLPTKTFSLVRKGFDPDEVRTYLGQVSVAVDALRAQAEAARSTPSGPVPPPAEVAAVEAVVPVEATPVEAPPVEPPPVEVVDDEVLAAARAELARLRADQAAVRAWFGEDGRATPEQVPGVVRDAAATADALVRAAEDQAAALSPPPPGDAAPEPLPAVTPEPVAATGAVRGWDELGGSVARILAGAEDEANAIRASAEASATITREEAEHLRARADEALAVAEQQASEVLAEAEQQAAVTVAEAERAAAATTAAAEAHSDELRRAADEGARAHVAEVMARAEADLARTRADPTPPTPSWPTSTPR